MKFTSNIDANGNNLVNAPAHYGSSASAGNLSLISTSHATKGKVLFGIAGNSAYDEANERIGIGIGSPVATLHLLATAEQFRISYDASNYVSFQVDSGGNMAISPTGTILQVTNSALVASNFRTASQIVTSNLNISTASAASSSSNNNAIAFGTAGTAHFRRLMRGSITSTITANASAAGSLFGQEPLTIAATGTHPIFATAAFKPLTVNSGTGSLTNTVNVYIEAAATGGTNNYALWVDDGLTRLDGNLFLSNVASAPATPSGGGILYVESGALKYKGSSGTITVLANA